MGTSEERKQGWREEFGGKWGRGGRRAYRREVGKVGRGREEWEREEWGEGGRRVGRGREGWGEGGRRRKSGGEGGNLVLLRKWVGMGKRREETGGGNGVIRKNGEVERMK